MYAIIEYKGETYTFVICPDCKRLMQVLGKKKNLKVQICYYCGSHFVEGE